MSRVYPLDLAIVGMACHGPGAPDMFAYWDNVLAGWTDAGDTDGRALADDAVAAAFEDAGLTPEVRDEPARSREGEPPGEPRLPHRDPQARGELSAIAARQEARPPGMMAGLMDVAKAQIIGRGRTAGPSTLERLERSSLALATHESDVVGVADDLIAADGRPTGEGVLVLKRLADAERDGDRVYAIVREVVEVPAASPGPAIAAAGMAGLIQAALALYHRVLPPDRAAVRPWIHGDPAAPRRVRVEVGSDLSGDVAHAVLEEHSASGDAVLGHPGAMLRWETEAILLSAPDRAGLADRVREVISWLESHPDAALKDIAYTLNAADRHVAGGCRLGVVASSPADLTERLSAVRPRLDRPAGRPIGDGRGTYQWDEPLGLSGGLAFLFPGEGSQYPGMLADLCIHFPEVRKQFDTADRIALEQCHLVLPSAHLFDAAEPGAALWSAPTAVNLILNAQWALYQVLARLGLQPDAVAGHSSGEILALAAAGVLRTDRTLESQLGRLGAIFGDLESAGDMPAARLVAVAADRHRAEAACRAAGVTEVVIAIDNCPHQVVLAGPPAEVDRVVAHLRAENILAEVLPFDRPYHTPGFAAVLGPIADSFAALTFRPPCLPVYSCATRERMPADPETIRALAVDQWTRTVAFRETVEAMHADGLRIFVDVGARGNLAGFVQDTLRGRKAFAIAANLPRRSGTTQLNHLVAALFAQGVPIRPEFLYARRRPRCIEDLVGCPVRTAASHPISNHRRNGDGPLHGSEDASPPSIESSLHPRRLTEPASLPLAARFQFDLEESDPPAPSEIDATMLVFQETMRAFLETQQAVIGAYLDSPAAPDESTATATTSGPQPGPWVGEVRRLVPGSEVESVYVLDLRSDPIAEHHTLGGRRVSALDSTLKGLPVLPFAVMAEMTAQAAALVVPPGFVLAKLTQLRAHKWVRYEEEPVVLELRGRREPSPAPGEEPVRVALYNRGPGGRWEAAHPVFEAVAVFAATTPDPPPAGRWSLEDPRASVFTADSIYREQWLFHGPALQAVVEVGAISARGIEGALRVLPWEPLLEGGGPARLHTDVIVIDSFTHLLGCWGLDHLADRGDVVFPLGMEELCLFGERPAVGTDVACRIAIEELQQHRVRVAAEIVRPDGTVWMQLRNWEDWRFHWPGRYRDVFRQLQDFFVGEELPLDDADASIKAVWLAPPADMGRPIWRDVLEQTHLGPAERAGHLAMGGPEDIRSRRLWGRIAAKEAARRLWSDEGRAPTYPADLAIVADGRGRPVLTRVDQPHDRSLPAIAIADADGVAVAIAARDPRARPGIAVASIPAKWDLAIRDVGQPPSAGPHLPASVDRGSPDDESAFTPLERTILARWTGPAQAEWSARLRCAREAGLRSAGAGIADDRRAIEVVHADATSGVLHVRIAATDARPMLVATARRGGPAWAWTLGQGVEP